MNALILSPAAAALAAMAYAAPAASDCNGNGIDDATDIANGTSEDCNGNGIPDECELGSGTATILAEYRLPDAGGGFGYALEVGDKLGGGVASLGDLDGDGTTDLLLGAPQDDDGGDNAGAVYVAFMNSDRSVKAAQKISATEGGFSGVLSIGDRFGASLAVLGDLENDGLVEVLVGAPHDGELGDNAGAIWLLELDPAGLVASETRITEGQGGFLGDLEVGDAFGSSLAVLGDVDGDGAVDVAAGAPKDDQGGENAGAVWILLLESNGTVRTEVELDESSAPLSGNLLVGDRFGSSVAGLGDLAGDGTLELAIGAPRADDGSDNAGAVWICSLDAAGVAVAAQKISALSGGLATALDVGDRFGSGLAGIGDHDADGVADLAVGAAGDDDGGENTGAIHLLFLDAAGLVQGEAKVSADSGDFGGDVGVGDDFGLTLANVGDLNGDGIDDLASGVPDDDEAGDNSGAAWLMTFTSIQNDCDGNGVPDECDLDCDGNGTPDACDLADDPSLDCNGNGIPDVCDIASGFSGDCDGNGRPDECDLADDPANDWNGDGILDVCSPANYCTANPNTTGLPAVIGASGSPLVDENAFTLVAWDLPANEFGYFLTSESTAFVPNFGGSQGNLCIGPPFYRFNNPAGGGEVLNSGPDGAVSFTLDLDLLPQGITFDAGETWYFQLWFRNVFSSNTTDGIEVMFR